MRVGIDARFLTHPQQGGFKSYTENLIRGLAEADRENEYVIYTDRATGDLPLVLPNNFILKPVGGGAVVREQITLPLAMSRDRIEIAHYLCNTAPVMSRCPVIVTIHDLLACAPGWMRRCGKSVKSMAMCTYWRSVTPMAAKRADHVITISDTSRREIVYRTGIDPDRITVIPTGIHPAFCEITDFSELQELRKDYELPERYVLAFASSDSRKNLHGVLSAWQRVCDLAGNCWLVTVCASDSAEQSVIHCCNGDPCNRRVKMLSGLTRTDLALLYCGAEALLFPSYYEGFGLPVVEAMACGTPVITSNVSALPEVAGDAALQVDPSDIASLSRAILRLLPDEKLRAELTMRGLKRAKMYSWDKTVSATISVYKRVYHCIHRSEALRVR